MFDGTDWRTGLLVTVGFLALIPLGWWVSEPGRFGGDPAAPTPFVTNPPTAVAVATTEDAPPPTPPFIATTPPGTTPPAPPPTEVATPAEVPLGQTVLFRGGPATGPWQQIGSVAEIHHPDASPLARFSVDRHWSDPAEENMPASLWDVIVADVAAEAVTLGPPVDRAAFDRDDSSVPHNAGGGVHVADFDKRVLIASWLAYYERPDGVAVVAHWPYVITFNGTILERGERSEVDETMFDTSAAAIGELTAQLEAWGNSVIADYEPPTS